MTKNLMEEPPDGHNFGQAGNPDPDKAGRKRALSTSDMLAHDIVREGGMGFVEPTAGSTTGRVYGARDAGMTAHRGILSSDEYVDYFELRERVEADLGFTYAAIAAAYKNGRPTADQRQLRDRIDSRLLALRRAGGNMTQLALAVGLNEKTLDRALARAEVAYIAPIVKQPAVVKSLPCFICSEPGRKRRRNNDTPSHVRGYVVLCDDHYAAGFETRKGNPAYWAFRDAKTPFRGNKAGTGRSVNRDQRFPDSYPSEASYRDFVAGERM